MSKRNLKVSYAKPDYYIYYKLADEEYKYRIINNYGRISTIDLSDVNTSVEYKSYGKIPMKFVEGLPDDNMLTEYFNKFRAWAFTSVKNKIFSVDLTNGDIVATQRTFFSLCIDYKQHKKIMAIEYKYIERCANNAIIYLKQNGYEGNCTTYDRKMAYPNILNSDLLIPTKPGKEYTLDKFGPVLEIGFYRVHIECNHPDFKKIFVLSKYDIYCNTSIEFLFDHRKEFKIKFKLIQDDQPNAYLYDSNDCIELSSMTHKWFDKVKHLKSTYGKSNPYMKSIASITWGVLNQRKYTVMSENDIVSKKINVGLSNDYKINRYQIQKTFEKNGQLYYSMVDTDKPYKYKLRLKPWVTAQARNDIATFGMKHGLDHIVRIQTDSITFDTEIINDDPGYSLEAKTTGKMHFYNVNRYENLTTGYHSKNFVDVDEIEDDDEDDNES